MCREAISDLEIALQRPEMDESDPLYPDMVFYLGKSYILCKDFIKAELIFRKMPELDKEIADFFIEDLKDMAENSTDPAVKEAIIEIINMMS
jgi:hypothetical protein